VLKGEVSKDLSIAISKLEEARKRFKAKEFDLQMAVDRATDREQKAQEKILEMESRMRETLANDAREVLKKFNLLRDELSSEVRKASSELLQQGATSLFSKISEGSDSVRQAIEGKGAFDPRARPLEDADFEAGRVVEVDGFGMGMIVERPKDFSKGAKAQVLVQIGDLQVTVARSRLLLPAKDRSHNFKVTQAARLNARERKVSEKVTQKSASSGGSFMCDVRGRTVDEGLRRVEASLNELFHNEDAVITVIHGHGSDRLKEAIREYIRKERVDLLFRPGSWPGEGGDGVTLIERAKR
jgi:DNA mismatch repair protein MutS2